MITGVCASTLEGLADHEAVDAGEHQVEDRQGGALGAGEVERGVAVERLEDAVALALEIEGHQLDDLPIVVHHQDRLVLSPLLCRAHRRPIRALRHHRFSIVVEQYEGNVKIYGALLYSKFTRVEIS